MILKLDFIKHGLHFDFKLVLLRKKSIEKSVERKKRLGYTFKKKQI